MPRHKSTEVYVFVLLRHKSTEVYVFVLLRHKSTEVYVFVLPAGISPQESEGHRLYEAEVIEISSDVSFILIVPRLHNVCAVPGHMEEANRGCIMLPVQVFEMSVFTLAILNCHFLFCNLRIAFV